MRSSEIFERTSLLEARLGQRTLTDLVEAAIEQERPLLVEAGTGIGKTLGYLIPSLLTGKRVVISTGTRALQDQVFTREVPRAYELLGREFDPSEVALMKGLSNYVCKRRLEAAASSHDPRAVSLARWASTSETGDIAEVDMPEGDPIWRLAQSSSETRIGAPCRHYERCFVTQMKKRAEDASVVIVNHHLYFADLALRLGPAGAYASVVPPHDVVIFDEAHQLEEIAMLFFGTQLSMVRIEQLARDAERLGFGKHPGSAALVRALREHGDRLLRLARESEGDDIVLPQEELDSFRNAAIGLSLQPVEGDDSVLFRRKAADLVRDLEAFGKKDERVRWIDRTASAPVLRTSPLSVGPLLEEHLFDRIPTVVLTSATLASVDGEGQPSMRYVRSQLGIPASAVESLLPSPFDVERRSFLYVPKDLPEPSHPSFDESSAERAFELSEITEGGALILTTSFRGLNAATRVFRSRSRRDLFVQGEGSKSRLLSAFRKSKNGVLLATLGFWEGVDVPGRALRLVVMDKLPFAVPSDPIVRARSKLLEEKGENPFLRLSVPAATILLKQGFGRLLRGADDFGLVAVLDRRLADRPYGRRMMMALPKVPLERSFERVRSRWDELCAQHGQVAEVGDAPHFQEHENAGAFFAKR